MSKKEVDFDKELEKLARQTNINIKKSEFAFENQLKRLDKDIDDVASKKIKEFDKNKPYPYVTTKHLKVSGVEVKSGKKITLARSPELFEEIEAEGL